MDYHTSRVDEIISFYCHYFNNKLKSFTSEYLSRTRKEEMERIHQLDGTGRFFNMSEEDQERWFLGSTIDFDAQK